MAGEGSASEVEIPLPPLPAAQDKVTMILKAIPVMDLPPHPSILQDYMHLHKLASSHSHNVISILGPICHD